MRKILTVVAALTVLAVPFACNFNLNSLQANRVMVGTLLSIPSFEIDAVALMGAAADAGFSEYIDAGQSSLDGSLSLPDGGLADDGGLTFDAGFLTLDGGKVLVPGRFTAFVFFGNRKSTALNSAPTGVSNAKVTVGIEGQTAIQLTDQGDGTYLSLGEDAGGSYLEGSTYQFKAEYEGATYIGQVSQVPSTERIAAFHPDASFLELPANAPFTFQRTTPSGGSRPLGFVTVVPLSNDGTQGTPTYTNLPQTPLEFLQLIAAPDVWKADSVTLPSTAFPNPNSNYLIVFQSAQLGGPTSDNLFVGSAFLAGAADVALVKTK